jgi:hypothetical protein
VPSSFGVGRPPGRADFQAKKRGHSGPQRNCGNRKCLIYFFFFVAFFAFFAAFFFVAIRVTSLPTAD